jgi:hypothetical protein
MPKKAATGGNAKSPKKTTPRAASPARKYARWTKDSKDAKYLKMLIRNGLPDGMTAGKLRNLHPQSFRKYDPKNFSKNFARMKADAWVDFAQVQSKFSNLLLHAKHLHVNLTILILCILQQYSMTTMMMTMMTIRPTTKMTL